jgi:hypothetical protein
MTFAEAAEEFIKAHAPGWRGSISEAQWRRTLLAYVYPHIGHMPVGEIETDDVLACLAPIWTAKAVTAGRVRGRIETILDAAKARGLRSGENPARWRGHLENLLPRVTKVAQVEHHAALPYVEIAGFMAELREQPAWRRRRLSSRS